MIFHLYDIIYTENDDGTFRVIGKGDFKSNNGSIRTGEVTFYRLVPNRDGTLDCLKALDNDNLCLITFND